MAVTGIGEELRKERLRQGLTLDDIARRTRISPRSLDAIEASQFELLPGIVFARSFVRLYAIDLKLDPEPLVARLPKPDIDAAPMPNPPARAGKHANWDPRVTAAITSVFWLVTAGGAGFGAWYYFNQTGWHVVKTVSAAKPAVILPAVVAPPLQAPLATPPATMPTAHATEPVEQASKETSVDTSRPVQVILTAREASWVQISADGRTAFVGMLHPHDTRSVAADAQVKIVAGNAGGIDISLNGKALDPIGPSGQVRTVSLTAEGPRFAPKNPPASSPL